MLQVLGTSFNPSPATQVAKNMINKLNDAITLHEINDEVAAKTAKLRQVANGSDQAPDPEDSVSMGGGSVSAKTNETGREADGNTSSGGAAVAIEDPEELDQQRPQGEEATTAEGNEAEGTAGTGQEGEPSGDPQDPGAAPPTEGAPGAAGSLAASSEPTPEASAAATAASGPESATAGSTVGGEASSMSVVTGGDQRGSSRRASEMPTTDSVPEPREKPKPALMINNTETADRVRRKTAAIKGRMQQVSAVAVGGGMGIGCWVLRLAIAAGWMGKAT